MSYNSGRYVYITRWVNEIERYVLFDGKKEDYLKVDVAKAQIFVNTKDADDFAQKMFDFGYDKPEVVKVLDT